MNKYEIGLLICKLLIVFLFIGGIINLDNIREKNINEAPNICNKIDTEFVVVESGFSNYVVCVNENKEIIRIKI